MFRVSTNSTARPRLPDLPYIKHFVETRSAVYVWKKDKQTENVSLLYISKDYDIICRRNKQGHKAI